MAGVSIMGGAELDIASGAELQKGLKSTEDSLYGRMRGLLQRNKGKVMRKTAVQGGVIPAAGFLTLPLFAVPNNSMCSLQLITVQLAADDHTTGAGVPVVYFGGSSGLPSRADIVSIGPSLPYIASWGHKTLWGHDGDECFVILYGVAAATNVLATAKYSEWPDGDDEPDVI